MGRETEGFFIIAEGPLGMIDITYEAGDTKLGVCATCKFAIASRAYQTSQNSTRPAVMLCSFRSRLTR